MDNRKKVPRRAYSYGYGASDIPIIGLGGSSFTTDWMNKVEKKNAEGGEREEGDLSWVKRDNPLVKQWISAIIVAVEKRGIDILDTAPWYGNGCSETVIGIAMEELEGRGIQRKDLILNTKVGRYSPTPSRMFDFSSKRIDESVVLSLERMKCGYIDVLQLHDPEFSPSLDVLVQHTIPAMKNLKEKGLVKAIGITGYPLDYQRTIIEEASKVGLYFDQSLTYCHYNLHDQSLLSIPPTIKDNTPTFADFCAEHNIGLMCAAPLSMGLLTPSGPPSWHPASPALKQACRKAVKLCEENKINISRLALLFAFSNPRIACTMIGVTNVEQIDFAADVACLLHDYHGSCEQSLTSNLKEILSKEEFDVLEQLLDHENGVFAAVYSIGEYQWDGMTTAAQFWEKIHGGKVEAANRMSCSNK